METLLNFEEERRFFKEKEERTIEEIPNGWIVIPNKHHNLELTLALKQRNLDKLEQLFWEVSNPKSDLYGSYLKLSEVRNLISPSRSDIDHVISWMKFYGVDRYEIHSQSNDFIKFETSIETASRILHCDFRRFRHEIQGVEIVKIVGNYSLPASIAPMIDFVSGFRFPDLSSRFKKYYLPLWSVQSQRKRPQLYQPTLPNGNSPLLVYINPLDSMAELIFLPRCKNGATTNRIPLCSDNEAPITKIAIAVNQTNYADVVQLFSSEQLSCFPCSQSPAGHFQSSCTAFNKLNSLPSDTVYCQVTLRSLHNYVATQFSMSSYYSDGSSGDWISETGFRVFLSTFVTPDILANYYQMPVGFMAKNPLNSQSVAEFLEQYYSPEDLSYFFHLMGIFNGTGLVDIIGPNNDTLPGGEASLDIQYMMGLTPNIRTVFWSLGTLHDGQEPFLEWITDVLNAKDAPLVHSVSYGDDEPSLSIDYMNRINAEFMKAGVRGLSLLFASGDSGVFGANLTYPCQSFIPSFPASSPYVTAVGATMFSTQTIPLCDKTISGLSMPCHEVGETTSSTSEGSRITSGGGFSNVFSMPDYQVSAVSEYLKTLQNIPSGYFKRSGRAYPDISAIGHNYLVVIDGEIIPVDGTSASTPVVAAMISLFNEFRLNQGKDPIGFFNPMLYYLASHNSSVFNDIRTGSNRCSTISLMCCDYGFEAVVGYDAATGLGTPRFNRLARAIMEFN